MEVQKSSTQKCTNNTQPPPAYTILNV